MSDLFGKYLGKLEVEVDGEKLELDVRLKDKHKIMSLMSKCKDTITEEALEGVTQVFKEILKRSYPDAKEEEIDAFLTKKFESFMTGLAIAFGWITKKEAEETFKSVKKGILQKEEGV